MGKAASHALSVRCKTHSLFLYLLVMKRRAPLPTPLRMLTLPDHRLIVLAPVTIDYACACFGVMGGHDGQSSPIWTLLTALCNPSPPDIEKAAHHFRHHGDLWPG